MGKIALAAVKRQLYEAKKSLQAHGVPVNLSELANEANIPYFQLHWLLCFTRPTWKAELAVVDWKTSNWNKTQIYNLYQFAAAMLLKEDYLPTAETLAEMLRQTPGAIRWYMNRHPDLATKINFAKEANMNVVYHAGRKIRFSGQPVTIAAIAEKTGLHQTTVMRIVRKDRDFFEKRIALVRQRKEHIKNMNKVSKKPEWLMRLKPKRKRSTRFPSWIALEERIITAVARRYGFEYEDISEKPTHKKGRWYLEILRNLAIYLLLEDAKLPIGKVLKVLALSSGGDSYSRIPRARAMIAECTELKCVQKELGILRSWYLT